METNECPRLMIEAYGEAVTFAKAERRPLWHKKERLRCMNVSGT